MSTAILPLTFTFDMKFFNKFFLALLCVALTVTLSISALAHSGRTDSNGGHHDGDEYHYHHGHPAHDHYDMDGDGDIDCPYDFHDNVDHGRENDSGKESSGTADTVSASTPSSTYREGKPPIVSLIVASAIVLALIIAPRHLFGDDLDKTSIISRILSFVCSTLPHAIVLLIIYLVKGSFQWAILSANEIVEAFVFAIGLGFAVTTILWLLSFAIASSFEKLFNTQNIFPSFTDSYAFSFAVLLFIRLIR